jgi:hypothetical protein
VKIGNPPNYQGDYVATPNDTPARRTGRFDRPWGEPDQRDVFVLSVSTRTFTELHDDLGAARSIGRVPA